MHAFVHSHWSSKIILLTYSSEQTLRTRWVVEMILYRNNDNSVDVIAKIKTNEQESSFCCALYCALFAKIEGLHRLNAWRHSAALNGESIEAKLVLNVRRFCYSIIHLHNTNGEDDYRKQHSWNSDSQSLAAACGTKQADLVANVVDPTGWK